MPLNDIMKPRRWVDKIDGSVGCFFPSSDLCVGECGDQSRGIPHPSRVTWLDPVDDLWQPLGPTLPTTEPPVPYVIHPNDYTIRGVNPDGGLWWRGWRGTLEDAIKVAQVNFFASGARSGRSRTWSVQDQHGDLVYILYRSGK